MPLAVCKQVRSSTIAHEAVNFAKAQGKSADDVTSENAGCGTPDGGSRERLAGRHARKRDQLCCTPPPAPRTAPQSSASGAAELFVLPQDRACQMGNTATLTLLGATNMPSSVPPPNSAR